MRGRMYEEKKKFDIKDLYQSITKKLKEKALKFA